MGIKFLNRYLLSKCSKDAIQKTHLRDFSGKTLVIDTSIYLYKFAAENEILENIYLMITIFKYYNIKPIFVFDGKSPAEKADILLERKLHKKDAEEQYNILSLELDELSGSEKTSALSKLNSLKKQFVRVRRSDIKKVKELLIYSNVTYYEAIGEADCLCVNLVKSGTAWACLSDDMDMFVYGCPRVFRHMSLLNHTVLFYDTDIIMNELGMTAAEMKEVLILSGTDYNSQQIAFEKMIKLFERYKSESVLYRDKVYPIYEWLADQPGNDTNIQIDRDKFTTVYDLFNYNTIIYQPIDHGTAYSTSDLNLKLKTLLSEHGFIFA
jgi:flap endonuclease-1